MKSISLTVRSLVVETQGERTAPELPALLQGAFQKLAAKLQQMPEGPRARLADLLLEKLTVDTLPADALLGSRGEERLAQELYLQLTRSLR